MSATLQYPHIETGSDGVARIAGSRHKVIYLAGEHLQHGWSSEELRRQHPDLRPEEVYAAMAYFYDHYAAMVAELERLQADEKRFENDLKTRTPTREELLGRKRS